MGRETLESAGRMPGSDSLQKRAMKRTVRRSSNPRAWVVEGEAKFSDSYDSYRVTLPEGSRKYHCTCQEHAGGKYRKLCSHKLAVILCRRGKKDFADEGPNLRSTPEHPGVFLVDETDPPRPQLTLIQGDGEGTTTPTRSTPLPGPSVVDEREGGVGRLQRDLPMAPPSPQHPMFGTPPIPAKFTSFRDHQWKAIREIVDHFENGTKVVFLGAPTGSGKTLIGETVRRLRKHRSGVPYLCTTKSLQNQILEDFSYGRMIKGRANYATEKFPWDTEQINCGDCNGDWRAGSDSCTFCSNMKTCPYNVAKNQAAAAHLGILNTAYFLSETSGQRSVFYGRDLVIIDEADALEDVLMGFIEIELSPRLRKNIGVKTLPKKTVADDWVRWIDGEVLPGIERRRDQLDSQISLFADDPKTIRAKREAKRLGELAGKLAYMTGDDGDDETTWVFTGYEGKKDVDRAYLKFKPVRLVDYNRDGRKVADLARELLWDRAEQFLLMSATLISPAQMAADLGLDDDEWEYVEVDSTFPPERRPVFLENVASVTKKTEAEAWPKVAAGVDAIIAENPGVRILVHTVSYKLGEYIYNNAVSDRVMTYWSSRERDDALERFLDRDDAVMLAPSFERGIDLPGEDCQVVVIAKVPYPYLGDKQISARMYGRGGEMWYAVQTIRDIVQMTGRGMRSAGDWCDTYILDSNFKRLFRQHKRLFPNWWKEALVLSRTDPKYKPLIKAATTRRESRRTVSPRD